MEREPLQPVKDPPNLLRARVFSLDRLLSHVDPGTAEESEDFVRRNMTSVTPIAAARLVVDTDVGSFMFEGHLKLGHLYA